MNRSNASNWRVARLLGFAMVMLALAVSGFAQGQSGNIFGTVVDADGAVLPGVTVTKSGIGATQVFVTDTNGQFRFLNLSPGEYTLTAELAGFGSVVRTGVQVNIGRNTNVTLPLTPALEQTITVTAETPLLDVRRTGTGATVTEVELEEVPSARDPWVILQQAPGVLMDRINVGGNESGQQSQFISKGVDSFQAVYSVDGVNTTDMIATGGSSAYYDFGSFEEIQITTGGTDPRIMTPGAQINLVTKRGTNAFNGSARYFLTDGDWQEDASIPEEARAPADCESPSQCPQALGAPNEIEEVTEWGAEFGGPIIRDRLWLWGAYAENDIGLLVAQPPGQDVRFTDTTLLETLNAKLNAQITANNSAVGTWTNNEKVKLGRNVAPNRPPETAWNQSGFGPEGTWKIEDTHIFSPNFFVTGMYSEVNGGFQLQPDSGLDCRERDCAFNAPAAATLDIRSGVWRNTFGGFSGLRPQEQVRLDASTFFDTGALNHEMRFGFGYREASNTSTWFWPQDQTILDFSGIVDPEFQGFGITWFSMSYNPNYEFDYTDFYVGDTILWDDLTLQVGVRYDDQGVSWGDVTGRPSGMPNEHQVIPELLPALTIPGESIPEWSDEKISPRIGATYALGDDNRTLLRAAYNEYVGQMGSNSTGVTALQPYYRTATFYTLDANGDDIITRDEILFDPDDPRNAFGGGGGLIGWSGFDPSNPGQIEAGTLRLGEGVDLPETQEIILGVERELLPEFVVGVNYTHRDFDNFLWTREEKTQGMGDFYTPDDYVLDENNTALGVWNDDNTVCLSDCGFAVGTLPDGTTYRQPVYTLAPGIDRPTFSVLMNRPGYEQSYDGIELSLVKRMSNRWMARANVSLMDWTQEVDPNAFDNAGDPTNRREGYGCSSADCEVVAGSGTISGAKGNVWINSRWSYVLTGVYQIPVIETNLGVNINGREGYPLLYGHTVRVSDRTEKTVLAVDDATQERLDDIFQVDMRISKDFNFGGVGLQIGADVFNLTNEQTIMQRSSDLVRRGSEIAAANRITELQSPRIWRVGARINF
ncbi:MAG: carboxypeptidase regulatory-like domain-containing protein [Acidobacteria bacterium]|nr:carboxypeptidase regulatory-like domain-containing protein [Acidobacteriota bacterium]